MDLVPDFERARHIVLIENTGQAVLKHLHALEDKRSLVLSRWVWELLQNARDAASSAKPVAVRVAMDDGTLRITHNGKPFALSEIAHLIYHGSTKQNLDDNLGRFGSGFISTHLINREVRVRGLLADSA